MEVVKEGSFGSLVSRNFSVKEISGFPLNLLVDLKTEINFIRLNIYSWANNFPFELNNFGCGFNSEKILKSYTCYTNLQKQNSVHVWKEHFFKKHLIITLKRVEFHLGIKNSWQIENISFILYVANIWWYPRFWWTRKRWRLSLLK